jgi:membrane protein YqaA with SNARE-associated domain
VAHLGMPGVFAVSAIDATVIPMAIPGSTDLLLLWLISHGTNPWILVAIAVAGSVAGGYTTWHLGKTGGEAALERYVPQRLQKRVRGWSQKHSILALMVPAILPPPIPLWPFLLAAGALGATWQRFMAAFGAGRTLRYALVGWLAVRYGRHVIRLWSATLDKWAAPLGWTFAILMTASLGFGIWKLRRMRGNSPGQPTLQTADSRAD